LPRKSRGPTSFTIPVAIDTLHVGKALLDLEANINLMSLSMMKIILNLEI